MNNGCGACIAIFSYGPVFCGNEAVQTLTVIDDGEYYTISVCEEHAIEYEGGN